MVHSFINIDKSLKTPAYQQLINQIIHLIQNGILKPGQQLPSSRLLGEQLGVHRKTIVQAFDDLVIQGWLEPKLGSGTYVSNNLPEQNAQPLVEIDNVLQRKKAGFDFETSPILKREVVKSSDKLHLDDGFPDPRIAPLLDLARAYRNNLLHGNTYQKLGYGEIKGVLWLRQELAKFLNESRGLNITAENIIIVRGTIMGLYLTNCSFLKNGDNVVMGESSWMSAKINFQQAGANVLTVPTDENGLNIDALEELCATNTIRLVYVTSHHDYPTTVVLKADRRLKLLKLAEKYRFIIFEDDYDYDFHYLSRPLMPLASADNQGVVLYSGSFTKSISPAFRVGYLVATEDVIEHISYYRRIIDRQGDNMLETAIAQLLHEGIIQKHLRKALKEYKIRRDFFCEKLKENFPNEISFQIPEGGMSVWAKFDEALDVLKTAETALKNGLYFSTGKHHEVDGKFKNYTRLGFASSTLEELEMSLEVLKKSLVFRN